MSAEPSECGIRRVRRPQDKEPLIEALRARGGGAFSEIRDVLLFASAVGYEKGRFEPISSPAKDTIRWETFINRWFAEDLVQMLAVGHSDDTAVVSAARADEQLEIFEGYVNGGLSVLQEELDRLKLDDPFDAVLEVLQASQAEARGVDLLIDLAVDTDF